MKTFFSSSLAISFSLLTYIRGTYTVVTYFGNIDSKDAYDWSIFIRDTYYIKDTYIRVAYIDDTYMDWTDVVKYLKIQI